jgi:hypothetical protein
MLDRSDRKSVIALPSEIMIDRGRSFQIAFLILETSQCTEKIALGQDRAALWPAFFA